MSGPCKGAKHRGDNVVQRGGFLREENRIRKETMGRAKKLNGKRRFCKNSGRKWGENFAGLFGRGIRKAQGCTVRGKKRGSLNTEAHNKGREME